jgi:hypothetical protein
MTPARLAGALLLLLPVLAACGGHRETKTERQIKSYVETRQHYNEVLKDAPADPKLDRVICETVPWTEVLACDITVRGSKTQRWAVTKEPRGKFHFGRCVKYDGPMSRERSYNPDRDPCMVVVSD